jgi:hypothetical protein
MNPTNGFQRTHGVGAAKEQMHYLNLTVKLKVAAIVAILTALIKAVCCAATQEDAVLLDV